MPNDTCEWTPSDEGEDLWDTQCGHLFILTCGTPKDHGFRFCCYCGKPLS